MRGLVFGVTSRHVASIFHARVRPAAVFGQSPVDGITAVGSRLRTNVGSLDATPPAPRQGPGAPPTILPDPLLAIYLACGWVPWGPDDAAETMRERLLSTASAFIAECGSARVNADTGRDLVSRVGWFTRLLELLPVGARDAWIARQVAATERQTIAAIGPHERLLPMLFDTGLPDGQRLQAQALWLAIVGAGPIWLDRDRRADEQAEARRLLSLAGLGPATDGEKLRGGSPPAVDSP
jgi:hypothetical protein